MLLADNPNPGVDALYDCVATHPDDYSACSYDRDDAVAASGTPFLADVAAREGLEMVDLTEWICPDGLEACPPAVGDALVLRQTSHLTATYATTLRPMLHRALRQVGWATTPLARIRP